MSLVSDLGSSIERYLLEQIDATGYPARDYRVSYERVTDNSLQVTLSVARGLFGLFTSRPLPRDILDDLEIFEVGLLNYLQRAFPEYNIYLGHPVFVNQSLIFTVNYYPKVELPPDLIKKILSYLAPEEAQRIAQALPPMYQEAFKDQYIWYMFVMNTYGPYYRFLEEIPLSSVNWRQLYQEIEKLRQSRTPMIFNNFLFKEAIRQNAIELVKVMLMDPSIDPMDVGDSPPENPYLRVPIKLAAERNHVVILKMLLDDPRVDPAVGENAALKSALSHSKAEAAEILLSNPKVTPEAGSLAYAIIGNEYDLFEKILPQVDPSDLDNQAVIVASEKGRIEMLNRLLQDPRVDPSAKGNAALTEAARNGHLDVVNRLLQDPRVNPAAQGNRTLIIAANGGHLDVINRLLEDPRVDPGAQGSLALVAAVQNNDVGLVERLLQDPRVDPLAQNYAALGLSARHGDGVIISMLARDPRVVAGLPNMPFLLRNALRFLW